MMSRLVVAAMALGVALAVELVTPARTMACSCVPPPPPAEAFQSATAVFEASVLSVEDTQEEGATALRVVMQAGRAWKGVTTTTVTVATAAGDASCGYPFELGTSYVVYATALQNGVLGVSLCSRTAPSSEAAEDLAALGPGMALGSDDVNAVPTPAGARDGCATTDRTPEPAPLVPAAMLAFIVAVVAARWVRRRS